MMVYILWWLKILFFLFEIFDDKILMSYKLWICWKNCLFERLFPHPNISEFHLLSYLTPLPPLISHYRYIKWIFGVEILGRQQLRTIFVELRILLLFYGIKHCIGELFWGCFVFGELELWLLWWDSRFLVSFI